MLDLPPRRAAALPAAALFAAALLVPAARAQNAVPERYVRIDGLGILPTTGLSTRFGPTASGSVGFGWSVGGGRGLELSVSGVRFPKGDVSFGPDTTGVGGGRISSDSLALSLALVGGAVRFQQPLARIGAARTRFVVGGGFSHWIDRRGSYPSRSLPETTRRAQWSGHLSAGLGADVPVTPRISLTTDALYHLLPADLWQTQRVRLQAVRTFQYATLSLGLKVGL